MSIIVAMDRNRVIGKDSQLPWHLPADLKHFKSLTMDKPVIMGRKTHESIGKPLPGRTNIVVTTNRHYVAQGCLVVHSLDDAMAATDGAEEIMVIGGAALYRQALPLTDRIYLTEVHATFDGDTCFPNIDLREWQEIDRVSCEVDTKNHYPYAFVVLERHAI